MPHLIIMRHSKSVDRSESDDDFDRGLTDRGRRDALQAGDILKSRGLNADLALVSPALRTLQTWQQIAQSLGDPEVQSPMSLYHASEDMLHRSILEAFISGAESLALVGHNPGIGALAHDFASRAGSLEGWPWGWPTSAVAVFEIASITPDMRDIRQILLHNPKAS